MADWIDVDEAQFASLRALGAPTRVVHQAKVPKAWDVTKLGATVGGNSKRQRKAPHLPTDLFRLGVHPIRPLRDGTNMARVIKAFNLSIHGSITDVRSRHSIIHTGMKALPTLSEGNISAIVSHLTTGGYLVFDEAKTKAKNDAR
jgi:hypothetical protein